MPMDGFIAGRFLAQWTWQWDAQLESMWHWITICVILTVDFRFVDFAMHRVRMLQHYGVIPYIIFDGDYLPSKAATEADRSKRREDSKRIGQEMLNAGKTSQAYLEFQKAVDVTPEMARQFIDELKKVGVQYIVAPYEADAQMVYLERKGIVDGIISEDSDLLVFGAKCLLTKLDQYGNCIEINKADFSAVKEISLTGWSDVEFRRMAILSGCDYLASMSNMGLKTAYRMVRKHKTIEKVLRMLQFDGKFLVPKGYLESYQRAELTFLHQRVFCPVALRLVLHTEPEQPLDDLNLPFLGAHVEPEVAQGVARGDLNPITKLPIVLDRQNKMENISPFGSASSPWAASRSRSQRQGSLGEAMKGTPIDSFFKAKRVPLAELDINCFTPSPTQQDALRRNSGPWSAEPVPRPYLNRSLTEVPSHARPTPTANSPQIGRTIRTPTISEPRPAKRARLCEDIDTTPSQAQKAETGSSRFFSTASEPSPSVKRTVKTRKSKKHDITIFSDDSVEEAMLSYVDNNMEVIKGEEVAAVKDEANKQADSESQAITDVDNLSQQTVPSLTASTSTTSSAEEPSTPTENCLPKLFHNLGERFAAGAVSTPKSSMPGNGNPTPLSTASRPSRIPLAIKTKPVQSATSSFFSKASLTPLQRLGASVNNRPKPSFTPPMTPVSVPHKNVLTRPRSLLSKNTLPFPEVATEARKRAVKQVVVEPASIPLPKPDENEENALSGNGSEDLIIHDSEEEDCLSPIVPRVNFSQFAYVQ